LNVITCVSVKHWTHLQFEVSVLHMSSVIFVPHQISMHEDPIKVHNIVESIRWL